MGVFSGFHAHFFPLLKHCATRTHEVWDRRQIQSGGQKTVEVSVLHEKGDLIAQAVKRTSNELHHIQAITERWIVDQRWTLLLNRLFRRWLGGKRLPGLPDEAELLPSG